ncbi:hypothetical protein LIER_11158 [Lithospermum erythrorhizon]|uniref:Exopolygalacturonase n=1 Tax=Lithospermum erythrorhizon TaxID=34254 RepID=A0AAV3PNF7_LITER
MRQYKASSLNSKTWDQHWDLGALGGPKVNSLSRVSNSSFIGTQNGARIKTFGNSFSSSVSNVTFENLKIYDFKHPIIIDQAYCTHNSCKQKGNSHVRITNVKFINIRGKSASNVSVQLLCSGKVPCQKIELQDLNLIYDQVPTKATCSNFNGAYDGNHQYPPNFINVD